MSSALLALGLLIAVGLPVGLLASRFGVPRVGAYVPVGVLFPPDILGGRLGLEFGASVEPVPAGALGVSGLI